MIRQVKYVIIHCSATDNPDQWPFEAVKHLHTASIEEVIKWGNYETRGRDWKDIGYHYYIERSGKIVKGRDDNAAGAHCLGYNEKSIGVCLAGNKEFTFEQISSLMILLKQLRIKHEDFILCGHCDLDKDKTCPNFNVKKAFAAF